MSFPPLNASFAVLAGARLFYFKKYDISVKHVTSVFLRLIYIYLSSAKNSLNT
jgi:hypothetical protein